MRDLELTDAIGHPIHEGDYVTAVWANAEVALFKVLGTKGEKQFYGSIVKSRYKPYANTLKLERTLKTDINLIQNLPINPLNKLLG